MNLLLLSRFLPPSSDFGRFILPPGYSFLIIYHVEPERLLIFRIGIRIAKCNQQFQFFLCIPRKFL